MGRDVEKELKELGIVYYASCGLETDEDLLIAIDDMKKFEEEYPYAERVKRIKEVQENRLQRISSKN